MKYEMREYLEMLIVVAVVCSVGVPLVLIWHWAMWPFQIAGAALGGILAVWQHERWRRTRRDPPAG